MILFRHLIVTVRRAIAASPGPFAFGLAVALGAGFGALLGVGGIRRGRERAAEVTGQRATRFASELERGLEERKKALRLLARMPSVVAHQGTQDDAFAAFRSVYPEFERVGLVETTSVPTHQARHRGPHPLRLTVTGPGGRVAGTLAADWPQAMLTRPDAFGTDESSVSTLLMGPSGSRTESATEPADPARIATLVGQASRILTWTDGQRYLTSVRRLRRTAGGEMGFWVVSGVPMLNLADHARRAEAFGTLFGAFFGLFAGTVAWVGIARSTRSLRALNASLEDRVERRTAELAAAEGSFRGIFEHVPLGLYQCDPEGRFLRVNPTLAQTLGFESPEALIDELGTLQAVGDRELRARFMARLRSDDEVREATTAVVRTDGRTVWLAERARAVRGPSGEIALIEGAMHDITAQRELETQLRLLGETDPLTGLLNRRGLTEAIAASAAPVSFVTLDVDRFKAYNDTYGHPAGDLALGVVANTLRENVRESDVVARAGGEEFVVVLPSTGAAGARRVAETLRAAVEGCVGLETRLTVSVGVATATKPEELGDAFAAADRALYLAKESGRNRVVVNPATMA